MLHAAKDSLPTRPLLSPRYHVGKAMRTAVVIASSPIVRSLEFRVHNARGPSAPQSLDQHADTFA